MKYSHVVKHNGTFYPAGADVPVKGRRKEPDGKQKDDASKDSDDTTKDSDDTTPPENDKSTKQGKSGK